MAYEPNSLDMTAPVQDPDRGYKHHPEAMESPKIRIRPESFADHHSQARLFWKSQTDTERTHIVAAFRFELSKVDVAAVRERMVGHLFDVDAELGGRVAAALGMPARQADMAGGGEAQPSPALSLLKKARETLETRKIGCLVADGVSADLVDQFRRAVERKGGKLMIVSMKRGGFQSAEGPVVPADFFVQGGPSILFDAVVLLGGSQPPAAFLMDAAAKHFAADAFAHLKTIAADDGGVALLAKAGIGQADFDEAVVPLSAKVTPAAISRFVASAARHRLWSREAKVSAPSRTGGGPGQTTRSAGSPVENQPSRLSSAEAHGLARLGRGAAQVWQQHDVLQPQIAFMDMGLAVIDVEPGGRAGRT